MGDWGSADGNDGFFGPTAGEAPTDNALFLLNQAAGRDLTVTVTAAGSAETVEAGDTLDFDAEVTMGDANHGNQKVTWTVQGRQSNSTSVNADGLLTVADDEYIGGELTVQALSTVDNTTRGTYTVKVTSPWDTEGIGDINAGNPSDSYPGRNRLVRTRKGRKQGSASVKGYAGKASFR